MKEAKIILTAVVISALIGGALAFKSTNQNFSKIYVSTTRMSTVISGISTTYTAPAIQPFCITTNLFTTNPFDGFYYNYVTIIGALTIMDPIRGGSFTYHSSCPATSGSVTTVFKTYLCKKRIITICNTSLVK